MSTNLDNTTCMQSRDLNNIPIEDLDNNPMRQIDSVYTSEYNDKELNEIETKIINQNNLLYELSYFYKNIYIQPTKLFYLNNKYKYLPIYNCTYCSTQFNTLIKLRSHESIYCLYNINNINDID